MDGGHGFSVRADLQGAPSSGTRAELLSVRGCTASPDRGGQSYKCAIRCVFISWARQLACGTASFGLGLRERASGTLSLSLDDVTLLAYLA